MIELLGKPVAQARKAVLQEKMQVLVDQGVTMLPKCMPHSWKKWQKGQILVLNW